MLTLAKNMPRKLTPEEECAAKKYIKENGGKPLDEIVLHLEKLFNTPVTRFCVTRMCVEIS